MHAMIKSLIICCLLKDYCLPISGADPGGGAQGARAPLSESLGIDFYSGYRKKNPGIDFRGKAQVGIDFQKA